MASLADHLYDPAFFEPIWQARWDADGLYRAVIDSSHTKHYALTMLPYPSGDLHIGHWYAMTPSDARARFMRMRGHNVFFPMGFDAFGLPAENAAIKRDIHPKHWTYANIERMRQQLKRMGTMIDWQREAVSCDPQYYRWTQWFFLRLFQGGLAYRKKAAVDFCPDCNTTLAREQVIGDDRLCERCETPVIRKELLQWFLRTTRYAEELLDFGSIDWPARVKALQEHWIGRSEGAHVTFTIDAGDRFDVFTSRPDTLWGVTFMVLAPEHPLVARLTTYDRRREVDDYVREALRRSEIQRESTDREKTGIFTGSYARNPVNDGLVPVWVADYVLMDYGTGAVMGVPAHDQRDFEFACKFGLEIRPVICKHDDAPADGDTMTEAMCEMGVAINSGPISGKPSEQALFEVFDFLEEHQCGRRVVNYRLRDWLISRQRYWGSPIPIVYCQHCGTVPVPETDLPVLLPDDVEWLPTGESPLKLHPTWRYTQCPQCNQSAERETDTIDTFLCSSWYHLRYLSPDFVDGPFDSDEYQYWMPVDTYTGGIEHATMHLIYTRFFHKACRDLGLVNGDEPMLQLRNQGIILGEDCEKMSKSRGNVVSPDRLVDTYGADAVRAYLMFFARWDQGGPWNSRGITGIVRWLRRVWTLVLSTASDLDASPDPLAVVRLRRQLHRTLRQVTVDFETFQFNTIVAMLMELLNEMTDASRAVGMVGSPVWREACEVYLHMLAPVAPHLAEELWHRGGNTASIHLQSWPRVDEDAAREEQFTLIVQVDGKLRSRLSLPVGTTEVIIRERALTDDRVLRSLNARTVEQIIVIPDRLVNIVTSTRPEEIHGN